jgi:hypothetical protein
MNKRRLAVAGVMIAVAMSLSLCGCGDDPARPAGYTSSESIEYRDWSANERKEIIDSISQTYNREIGSRNKIITNQLERQDSDFELMNDRYSYGQNITAEGFIRR